MTSTFLVGEDRFHAAVGFRDAELRGLGPREVVIGLAEGDHFHKTQPPRRFHVRRPDEPGPNDTCLD
jgi:hypothetical protein